MASSLVRLRRFVREYNDLVHNNEKRLEAAETRKQEVLSAVEPIRHQWNDLPASEKTFARAVQLTKALDGGRRKLREALDLAQNAKADLEGMESRYAELLAEVSNRKNETKVAEIKAVTDDVQAECSALRQQATELVSQLEGLL